MAVNKRFIIKPYEDTFNKVIIDELDQYRFPPLQHDFSNVRFRNALNGLWEHNQELTEENEELKSDAIYWSQNAEARLKEIDKLRKEKEQLKDTLAFRSNQLALMEKLIDDLGSEEMARQMKEILE